MWHNPLPNQQVKYPQVMLLIDEILRAHPSLEPSFSAFGFIRSPHLVSAGGDEVRAPVDEVRRTQRSPRNEEREEDLSESDLPFMFIHSHES